MGNGDLFAPGLSLRNQRGYEAVPQEYSSGHAEGCRDSWLAEDASREHGSARVPARRAGGEGTIAVPCILGHLSQLLIDSYVATKWSDYVEAKPSKNEEVDPEAAASGGSTSTP